PSRQAAMAFPVDAVSPAAAAPPLDAATSAPARAAGTVHPPANTRTSSTSAVSGTNCQPDGVLEFAPKMPTTALSAESLPGVTPVMPSTSTASTSALPGCASTRSAGGGSAAPSDESALAGSAGGRPDPRGEPTGPGTTTSSRPGHAAARTDDVPSRHALQRGT